MSVSEVILGVVLFFVVGRNIGVILKKEVKY